MQTKEELAVAIKELLYYLYHNKGYLECPYLKYKVSRQITKPLPIEPPLIEAGLSNSYRHPDYAFTDYNRVEGSIYLDGRDIAKVISTPLSPPTIESINFHGRYDMTIRTILESLDVELVKFGKTWIGYLSGKSIPIPSDIRLGHFIPEKIHREYQVRKEREEKLINERVNSLRQATRSINIPNGGTSAMDSNLYWNERGILGNLSTTTATMATTSTAWVNNTTVFSTTAGPTSSIHRTEYYTEVLKPIDDSRPVPANPALAAAQRKGISHRRMEEMIRKGRMR